MILIIIIMYITITVLSIITFGIKGSLVLLIISPLLIVYLNSNSINIKKKNEKIYTIFEKLLEEGIKTNK